MKRMSKTPRTEGIRITSEIEEALIQFIESHPPHVARRNLRKMFTDYLKNPSAVDEVYYREVVQQVDAMFDLLDVIDDSLNPKKEFLMPSSVSVTTLITFILSMRLS